MLLQMPQHEFTYTFAMNACMKIVKRDGVLSMWWRLNMTSFPMREWIKPHHSSIPLCNNNDIRGTENENMDGNRHRWEVRGRVIEGVCEWLNRLMSDVGDSTEQYRRGAWKQVKDKRWWWQSQKGSLHFHPYSSIHPSMQPVNSF